MQSDTISRPSADRADSKTWQFIEVAIKGIEFL